MLDVRSLVQLQLYYAFSTQKHIRNRITTCCSSFEFQGYTIRRIPRFVAQFNVNLLYTFAVNLFLCKLILLLCGFFFVQFKYRFVFIFMLLFVSMCVCVLVTRHCETQDPTILHSFLSHIMLCMRSDYLLVVRFFFTLVDCALYLISVQQQWRHQRTRQRSKIKTTNSINKKMLLILSLFSLLLSGAIFGVFCLSLAPTTNSNITLLTMQIS